MTLYDRIGRSYARHRAPDPRIAAQIAAAINDAKRIVNVGAGSGSYEPAGPGVIAVEPSSVMIAQRAAGANPVVSAFADALPFADGVFEVALAVMTVHHWSEPEAGLREVARVASRSVVLAFDIDVLSREFWLVRDYLPETIALESATPTIERIAGIVGATSITPVPIPADCRDGFLPAYWARPEAFLDPSVRSAISAFHRIEPRAIQRMVGQLSEDLATGAWEKRYGSHRSMDSLDVGFRLIA